MSSEATEGQTPDVYGQKHPVETESFIAAKQAQFEMELNNIPPEEKTEWLEAEAKCAPELIGEDFKLKFLRCEVFNADLAAKRFVGYWKKRCEIFGPKAFGPINLHEALSEDEVAVGLGVMTLLRGQDPMGRSLVYWDPSYLDSSKYTTESMVRAFWYVLHAAVEPVTAQQHGIIVLVDPQRAGFTQFDSTIGKLFMSSMSGVLPLRLSGIHICFPPYFVNLVLPVAKLFMTERMQKRILFHSESVQEVSERFAKVYGLTAEVLPVEIGGAATVDHQGWLNERRQQGK
eukprot:Nitzschia sp. Nitz4//scaffold47_size129522//91421//92442//NITZ4_003562-RA/size129522-processed-gene-0.49-mRNA-1//-1//CDS//3329552833//6060//frame0